MKVQSAFSANKPGDDANVRFRPPLSKNFFNSAAPV